MHEKSRMRHNALDALLQPALKLVGAVEVDDMLVGRHIRPENRAEDRIDGRFC